MKKSFSLAILVGLSACGGSGTTTTEIGPVDVPEVGAPSTAVLVDSVEWEGETIDFYNMQPEAEEPMILTQYHGQLGERELLSELERSTTYPVTPAEIWLAATGRQDVPDILASDHVLQATRDARPSDYQVFEVDKAFVHHGFTFSILFPSVQTSCWGSSKISPVENVSTTLGVPSLHACTSPKPSAVSDANFVIALPVQVASNCTPSTHNTTDRVRVGVYNNANSSIITMLGDTCSSQNSGAWTCLPTTNVQPDNYLFIDQAQSSTKRTLAVGVTQQQFASSAVFAAAKLVPGGVPQFGTTSCGPGQ